jgi:chromosome segregation ATPase
MTETLGSVLKDRIRAVLDRQRVTEGELRQLAEEGRACARTLDAQLERRERWLAELSADRTSSLVEMAAVLRDVGGLRPDLEELERLLDDLDARAHELRASWLSAS